LDYQANLDTHHPETLKTDIVAVRMRLLEGAGMLIADFRAFDREVSQMGAQVLASVARAISGCVLAAAHWLKKSGNRRR
jgi:hypothetical protein